MTDNEIIKALECCGDDEICFCSQCPLYIADHDNDFCQEDLHRASLNLINRQKADKQSLKYDYDNLQRQFDEIYQQFHYLSNVEIPYLYSFTEDKDKKLETIANILLRTKAEAYKEFAERLKEHYDEYDDYDDIYVRHIRDDIDFTKNDMVGDTGA